MQLPKELQHFPEPTLIVLTDEQQATFLLAGGDTLEELKSLTLIPDRLSDREGTFSSSDHSHVGSDLSDAHDTPRKKKFAEQITDQIRSLIHDGHATKIRLVSPPEMLHLIEERLPQDLQQLILSKDPHNLMKHDRIDVLKRMFTLPE
ncbi:hypothetical protein GF380_04710 [Candidatus Uhrbacteria bacterium]|nr:hypothetical protein [Candidatus Uhrbacteria bacterium]MBD3284355.1 hypothetical protein [Candidatus Uhrbacteria bacterium]